MKPSINPFPKQKADKQISQTQQQQLLQILQSNPQLMQKYQQQLTKMNSKSPSLNKTPMTTKQYLKKLSQIDKYLDQQGGLTIQPDSGFVLKFLQKKTGQKIFVNIVTHAVVDHPQQKILVDLDNQAGLRIPMSMGRIKQQTDKNQNPCKVVDVVFNPKIVQTAQTNPDILMFMAQIIGNYLLEKYKITISDEKLHKVKGLKYKGTNIQIQRVKGKKSPKIQQIHQESIPQEQIDKQEQLFNKINHGEKKTTIEPQFQVFALNEDNHREKYSYDTNIIKIKKLQILFNLPHLIHSKGIHLEGSGRLLYLNVRNLYEICLKIPIQTIKWQSKFSRKQRKLLVEAYPYKEQENKQIIQNKPLNIEVKIENDLLYDIV